MYEQAFKAYQSGCYGDFDAHTPMLGGALSSTWRCILRLQMHQAGLIQEPPDAIEIAEAEDARVTSLALSLRTRQALLCFDTDALKAAVTAHSRLRGGHPLVDAHVALGEGWLAFTVGAAYPVERLIEAEQAARHHQDASHTIEATVLQSLFEPKEGLRSARRASRMSRTEGMPQPQYLANLMLARHRRLQGRPHLSAHILRALLRVAPAPWRAWMHWELSLAGVVVSNPIGPSRQLVQLVRAALEAQPILAADHGFIPVARDLKAARDMMLGAGEPQQALTALASFHPDKKLAAEPVWAIAVQPPRSVLNLNLSAYPHVKKLMPGRRRRERTDSALCQLIMRGAQDEADFFEQLYGFAYEVEVHRGTRDMLYHRMRERLGAAGELIRDSGHVQVNLHEPIAVPDPRWSPAPENAILNVLAQLGAATPKEAADALGLPLRTAQHVLRTLADDGACRLHKEGRRVRYAVQDTTFVEPTQRSMVNAQVMKDS